MGDRRGESAARRRNAVAFSKMGRASARRCTKQTASPARRRGSNAGRSPTSPRRSPPTLRSSTFSRTLRAPASGHRDGCGMVAFYTVDLEALVAEVEKYPLLYDPGHREQRDFFKRSQAWKAIAKAINATPSACKVQWKNVRDRFVREKRLSMLQSQTEDDRLAKWDLYRHLGFLVRAHQRCYRQSLSGAAGSESKAVVVGQRGPSQSMCSVQDTTSGHEHPLESTQCAPVGTLNLVTVKQNPPSCATAEDETGSGVTLCDRPAPAGKTNSAHQDVSVLAQSWRHKRESSTSAESALENSRRADSDIATGADDGDNRAGGSKGNDRDDVSSTNALRHHLVTATERVQATAESVLPCRLPHLDLRDSDILFVLSLVETLRSFGPEERSLALVKLQEVIREVREDQDCRALRRHFLSE